MSSLAETTVFERRVERYRREIHVHCYRMLASFDEAEDAVQEACLRAWRARDSIGDGGNFRAWLYRIATNVCIDMLRSRSRRRERSASPADLPWLQAYPDRLLDEVESGGETPESAVVRRETIELAFLVALQVLPPRQRAVLLLRDVLGLSASETASLLETSAAAANSALQRARVTMKDNLPSHRSEWNATPDGDRERKLLERFIDAHEQLDAEAALSIVADDITVTMPPYPHFFEGIEGLMPLLERGLGSEREGDWRLLPTGVNRMPAAASYLKRRGDTELRPLKLDILRIENTKIAEITTLGPDVFPSLGLPERL